LNSYASSLYFSKYLLSKSPSLIWGGDFERRDGKKRDEHRRNGKNAK